MLNEAGKLRIGFVSTMNGVAWGGSEELWSETALRLIRSGHRADASVLRWPRRPAALVELARHGVGVVYRPRKRNFLDRTLQRCLQQVFPAPLDLPERWWLKRIEADLMVISQGGPWDGVPWMLACRRTGVPYCCIVHANSELWWPLDERLDQIREAFTGAKRIFFVSRANHSLMELQIGMRLANAEVVANPCKVDRPHATQIPWPSDENGLQLACVGRIAPEAKGQDILFKVLARPEWRNRSIQVNMYGTGPSEKSIKALAAYLELKNVTFHGYVSDLRKIWETNHALVLPSRFEGLPLAIIETMLCGRPVITTDVAGNAEIVRDGVNGFVAAAPTVDLLHEAMEKAWICRDEWKSMGGRAFRDALEKMPDDPVGDFARKLLLLVVPEPVRSVRSARGQPKAHSNPAADLFLHSERHR